MAEDAAPTIKPAAAAVGRYWPWIPILTGSAGLMLITTATWSVFVDTGVGCGVREGLQPLRTPSDRLGIVISRFVDNDLNKMGQKYLSSTLSSDRALRQHAPVLTTCRMFPLTGSSQTLQLMNPQDELLRQSRKLLV